MKSLGIVKWYNIKRGFGFIITPKDEEVFFHCSNLKNFNRSTIKNSKYFSWEGTVFIFNIKQEGGKTSAKKIRLPKDYDDFLFILSHFSKKHDVSIIDSEIDITRRGVYFNKKEYHSTDLINEALLEFFNHTWSTEVLPYFKKYFDTFYSGTNKDELFIFLNLSLRILRKLSQDKYQKEIKDFIHYLLANTGDDILFELWKTSFAKRHFFSQDKLWRVFFKESSFQFPERIFVKNYTSITLRDIQSMTKMSNGSQILSSILPAVVESFTSIDQQEISKTLEAMHLVEDPHIINTLKQSLSIKFLNLINDIDYSNNSDIEIENFHFIIDKAKTYLGSPIFENLIVEFNNNLDNEIIFNLWQKTRYFEPDTNFFQENFENLTYDDFINANESFHYTYFQDSLNKIGEIKDISTFGLLICTIIETPTMIINEVIDSLSFKYQISLWLSFPREKIHNRKHYEANYNKDDTQLSLSKVIEYFNQLQDIDDLLKPCALIKELQDRYTFKTQMYGDTSGFWRLNTSKRIQLVEEVLASTVNKTHEFLSNILARIDENHALSLIDVILPHLTGEKIIPVDKLVEIIQRLNFSETTKRSLLLKYSKSTSKSNRLHLWLDDQTTNILFSEIIEEFNTISIDKQPKLLRKTFWFLQSQKEISTEYFLEQIFSLNNKDNINLDVRICIKVIESLKRNDEYTREKTISEIICSYLDENINEIIQIQDLFEECNGRTWMTYGEQKKKWYINIEGKNFPVSDDQVIIGGEYYFFDRYNKNLVINEQTYRFRWVYREQSTFTKLYEVPAGLTFCDAKKSEYDEELKQHFHWCCNSKCYAPCQSDHIHLEWSYYSLRDFIKILNIPFNQELYYRFVSLLNRANRLLKKLQCTSCKKILRDAKTSEFAFYRVTTFHCTNPECDEHHNIVYLNHCLNWRCLNIVDNRVSVKCPNGWFICDSCSSCCSQEKIERRYENLITNNAFNPNNKRHLKLKHQVDNMLGHLEKEEMYNYKTGEKGKAQFTDENELPF